MYTEPIRFDASELLNIAEKRCGLRHFVSEIGISKRRLAAVILGIEEFSHEEMLRAAKLLKLSDEEFVRCFFYASEFRNSKLNNKGE